jgi:hypothetical protein
MTMMRVVQRLPRVRKTQTLPEFNQEEEEQEGDVDRASRR